MARKLKFLLIGWWIFLAGLISLVFGFYHFMIPRWEEKINYSPLVLNQDSSSVTFDEAISYAPKVREILDGHWKLSDPFIFEYKNTASPFVGETLPAMIMAGLSKLSGRVTEGFILADFIWPPMVFLSLSYFIYLLTKKFFLAPVVALIVMFWEHYLSWMPYLPSVIKNIISSLNTGAYSRFIRSFHPQISFFFFVLFLIFLWQGLSQKKSLNLKIKLALGISLGLLFYSYLFFWTYALGWLLLIMLEAGWKKNWVLFKGLAWALTGAIILALPYLINLWIFRQLPLSDSFIANSNYLPILGYRKDIGLMLIMLVVSRVMAKNNKLARFFQWFYLTGLILVVIVLGLDLSIDDMIGHWMGRVVHPLTIIFGLGLLIRQLKKNYLYFSIAACLLLLGYQARIHQRYFKNHAYLFHLEPERLEAFEWLNQNTQKDSVVLTTSLVNNLYLPIYTHNNSFIPRAPQSLTPSQEALERFLLVYKKLNVPKDRIKYMFRLNEKNKKLRLKKRFDFDDCGGHYIYFRRFIANDYYNCSVPVEHLETIIDKYQTIKVDRLETWRQKYRIDYWLWGPNEEKWAQVNPGEFSNWQLIWQNQDYKLFKLL